MLFLANACTGCRVCQLICSLTHEGQCNLSLSRVAIKQEGLDFSAEFTPECDECARCARYCPYRAIVKGE
ncbi:MAG: hypothetical protein SWK76_00575 [Actinomycetota bacterium]|nr:hypothetical protein [Actinomycetota bacterium]